MQKYFEKIKDRLEEKKDLVPVNRLLDDIINDKPMELGQLMAYAEAIEVVNQVAEEYVHKKQNEMYEAGYTKALDDAIKKFLEYGCFMIQWTPRLSKEDLVADVMSQVKGQAVYTLEKMKQKEIDSANQVAEECAPDTNVSTNIIGELKEFLREKKEYNSEQADIWRGSSYTNSHSREMKDLYIDRANAFGSVLREIKVLENKYGNDGWISLPKVAFDRMIARMESESERDIYEEESLFINVRDAGRIIKEIAAEYQPKGEE